MLFRFQWHPENVSQELGVRPWSFAISPLRVIRIEQTHVIDVCLLLILKCIETSAFPWLDIFDILS